ncbi:MAG: DNA repair protein RecN, partial [Planctomycetota bacterium]
QIHKVLHKYGGTMESAIVKHDAVRQQIKQLAGESEDLSQLEQSIAPLEADVVKLGGELRRKRQAAAKKLGPTIETQLAELGMEKATFRVGVEPAGETVNEATPSGMDRVEFIAQTNPGLDAQPLRRIASGGELSRIMLALKQVLSGSTGDRVSVLVFDEIDANVGGRLASVVGDKLRKLASEHQVLCITHLPQIASYADRHLTVQKVQGSDTKTTVRQIDGEDRLDELAEMIGGKTITKTTKAQAREMLVAAGVESGRRKKRKAS